MFEAYSVGVKLSLISNVAAGLVAIAHQMARTHGNAVQLQNQLNRIRLTLAAGGALVAAGAFGFLLIDKAVKPATEYAHQLAQMQLAGMKNLEIARATAAAWNAAYSTPTSTATENLAAIRELRMVFGDTNHAIQNMPVVQRLQAILANTSGSGGHDEAYTVAKALEMKGATRTPGEFNTQADLMAKAIIAAGGKITARDFLGTFKYGRSATIGWSDQFTYSILPTLIQEMRGAGNGGAGGPGNALMSAYATVVGGTIPQKALKVWQSLGLLDPSKIVWTRAHEAKGVGPGGVVGSALFQTNPYAWAQTILIPALHKAGKDSEKDVRQTMQYLFPNRTAGFIMQQMTMQGWKFDRDRKLIAGTMGLGGYDAMVHNDPKMVYAALMAQWENALTALGITIMPALIKATWTLTTVIRSLGQWMIKHQTAVKILAVAFVALSAAMEIGGTILLIVGAFAGLALVMSGGTIAIAIAAVTAALAGLAYVASQWDDKKSTWQNIGDILVNVGKGMWNLWVGLDTFIDNILASPFKWLWNNLVKGEMAMASQSPFVPSNSGGGRGGHGNVYIDGHKVGAIVTHHQARAAGGANTGSSFFDGLMDLAPVAAPAGVW